MLTSVLCNSIGNDGMHQDGYGVNEGRRRRRGDVGMDTINYWKSVALLLQGVGRPAVSACWISVKNVRASDVRGLLSSRLSRFSKLPPTHHFDVSLYFHLMVIVSALRSPLSFESKQRGPLIRSLAQGIALHLLFETTNSFS
jgi:hypothetical protein